MSQHRAAARPNARGILFTFLAFAATMGMLVASLSLSPTAAHAAGMGLGLSIVDDDSLAALTDGTGALVDGSTTNGKVPTNGGTVNYKWEWANAVTDGAGNMTLAETLPNGMGWDTIQPGGCAISVRTLTCTLAGITEGASGSTVRTAHVGVVGNGTVLTATLNSGAETPATASVTAVGITPHFYFITSSQGNAAAVDPGGSGQTGQKLTMQFRLIDNDSNATYGRGLQPIGTPLIVTVTVPDGSAVASGCNNCTMVNSTTLTMNLGTPAFNFTSSDLGRPVLAFWVPDSLVSSPTNSLQATIAGGTAYGSDGTSTTYAPITFSWTIGGPGTITQNLSGGLGQGITTTLGTVFNTAATVVPPSGQGVPAATGLTTCQIWDPTYLSVVPGTQTGWTFEYGTKAYANQAARNTATCGTFGTLDTDWFSDYASAAANGPVTEVRARYSDPSTVAQTTRLNFTTTTDPARLITNSASTTLREAVSVDGYAPINIGSQVIKMWAASSTVTETVSSSTVMPTGTVVVTIQPDVSQPSALVTDGRPALSTVVTATLPNGCFTFQEGNTHPFSVTPAAPAAPGVGQTCDQVAGQVVTWNLFDVPTTPGVVESPITYTMRADTKLPNHGSATVSAKIDTLSSLFGNNSGSGKTLAMTAISQLLSAVSTSTPNAFAGTPFTYTLNWANGTGSAIPDSYLVDLLPYNGDARGTAGLDSLAIGAVDASGLPVQYSVDSPAAIAAALATDKSGSTGIDWSAQYAASGITAIRIHTGSLAVDATGSATFSATPAATFTAGGLIVDTAILQALNASGVASSLAISTPTTVYAATTTVSGTAYNDLDFTGAYSAGDSALSGDTVTLTGYSFGLDGVDNTGAGDDVAVPANTTQTVDSGGNYSFVVAPGKYSLSIADVTGLTAVVSPPATFFVSPHTPSTQNFLYQATIAAPVAVSTTASVSQGGTVNVPVFTLPGTSLGLPPTGTPASTVVVGASSKFGTVTLTGGATAATSNNIRYVAPVAWQGGAAVSYTDTITYTVTNAQHRTSTATVTVTVYVLPTAGADSATVSSTAFSDTSVLGNDTGSGLTVSGASISNPAVNGSVSVQGGTKVRYTPVAHAWGPSETSYTRVVTYTIQDSLGKTTTASVSVLVHALPSAVTDTATVPFLFGSDTDVLANDSGESLSLTSVNALGTGAATIVGGQVHFVPGTHTFTTDSYLETVTYTATDVRGKVETGTLTLTVVRPPTAVDDTAVTVFNASVFADVLANDHVRSTPGTLSVPSQPALGTASVSGGQLLFTPASGQVGTVAIGYVVTDALGQTASGTLTVTVAGALLAVDDGSTISPLAVTAPGRTIDVLANDSGSGISVTGIGTPSHGTVVIDPLGTVTYTRSGPYLGDDSFTYTITDIAGVTATASVYLNVTQGPALADDTASTDPTTPVTIDVLANDTVTSGPATITAVTQPANGSATFTASDVTFTPLAVGTQLFTYTVQDALGRQATANVTVTVAQNAPATLHITMTTTTFTVTGSNLGSGSPFEVWLHSTPTMLVSGTVGGTGALSQTYHLPTNIPAGNHTLTVLSGGLSASVSFRVNDDGTLAFTGTDPLPTLSSGLGLVGIGILLTLLAAYRRRGARARRSTAV